MGLLNTAYIDEYTRHAWGILVGSFVLWWLFILISGVFGGFHRTRARGAAQGALLGTATGVGAATGAAAGAAVPPATRWGEPWRRTYDITRALRDIFLTLFFLTVMAQLFTGIDRGVRNRLAAIFAVGTVWALLRGIRILRRFTELFALPVVVLALYTIAKAFRGIAG